MPKWNTYLARLMATFKRFLFLIKPSPYFPSWEMYLSLDLTVEMIMTSRSWPWNSSTLPTFGDFPSKYSSHSERISFTCSVYGVIIPIESSLRPHCLRWCATVTTCIENKKQHLHYFRHFFSKCFEIICFWKNQRKKNLKWILLQELRVDYAMMLNQRLFHLCHEHQWNKRHNWRHA